MRPFPFKRLFADGFYVTLFNLGCALAITFVLGAGHFWQNLVFSMCIGTTAWLLIDSIRLLIWGRPGQRPLWLPFLLVVVVAVPVAQVIGAQAGAFILGISVPPMALFAGRNINMLFFTLLATAAAVIFFTNREHRIRAEGDAERERARALQAQLQLLQAQIEPHMLFNTLANVQGLIAIDPSRAQHMLDQLITYLRATLSASRAASTTLGQEFDLMGAYLGLMEVRMGARLRHSLDLAPELRGIEVPPMLLQPLVENAIAHGLEPKIEGGQVSIHARRDGASLLLEVRDDGRGPDAPPGKASTRVGLANICERLQALYGERASFSLVPLEPAGASATIRIPL